MFSLTGLCEPLLRASAPWEALIDSVINSEIKSAVSKDVSSQIVQGPEMLFEMLLCKFVLATETTTPSFPRHGLFYTYHVCTMSVQKQTRRRTADSHSLVGRQLHMYQHPLTDFGLRRDEGRRTNKEQGKTASGEHVMGNECG